MPLVLHAPRINVMPIDQILWQGIMILAKAALRAIMFFIPLLFFYYFNSPIADEAMTILLDYATNRPINEEDGVVVSISWLLINVMPIDQILWQGMKVLAEAALKAILFFIPLLMLFYFNSPIADEALTILLDFATNPWQLQVDQSPEDRS